MGLLKSAFVSAFIAWLVLAGAYALVQLARGSEPLLSWFGVALAALAPLSFFAWAYVAGPARTERHPVAYSVISGLGLAIAMTMAWRHGQAAGLLHAWAAISIMGWLIYLRWYSTLDRGTVGPLATGARLPEFGLLNLDGRPVSSSLFRGRPHVLVFIRGNWCPFCTAQVRELARCYREIEQTGARVVIISPQPLDRQRALARRFDAPLEFLRDPENTAARQLGIASRHGTPLGLQWLGYDSDTVLPTVIITRADGTILYRDLTDNYRIRPHPQAFLQILQADGAATAGG